MDFTVGSSTVSTSSSFPLWDLDVVSGIVPFITGSEANVQAASISAYLQIGSIPQLPGTGVPWVEFLTNQVTFGDLDAAIRGAALNSNVSNFVPEYSFVNSKLVVTMKATLQAGTQ